jgi:hypothetical protein
MTLRECEAKAQAEGFDRCLFVAHFPVGARICRWGDAYMGMFMIMDVGVTNTRDIEDLYPDLECNAFEVCTAKEADERVPIS